MSRTIHVGNLTPFITAEQLRLLFSFYGTVTDVRMAGDNNQYAFVEFATSNEAMGALAMNGQVVGDRALRVSIAGNLFRCLEFLADMSVAWNCPAGGSFQDSKTSEAWQFCARDCIACLCCPDPATCFSTATAATAGHASGSDACGIKGFRVAR